MGKCKISRGGGCHYVKNGEVSFVYSYGNEKIPAGTFIEDVTSLECSEIPGVQVAQGNATLNQITWMHDNIWLSIYCISTSSFTYCYLVPIRVNNDKTLSLGNPVIIDLVTGIYGGSLHDPGIIRVSDSVALLKYTKEMNPDYGGVLKPVSLNGMSVTISSKELSISSTASMGLYFQMVRNAQDGVWDMEINDNSRIIRMNRITTDGTGIGTDSYIGSRDLPSTMVTSRFAAHMLSEKRVAVLQGNYVYMFIKNGSSLDFVKDIKVGDSAGLSSASPTISVNDQQMLTVCAGKGKVANVKLLHHTDTDISVKATLVLDVPYEYRYFGFIKRSDKDIMLIFNESSGGLLSTHIYVADSSLSMTEPARWVAGFGGIIAANPLPDSENLAIWSITDYVEDNDSRLGALIRPAVDKIDGITLTAIYEKKSGKTAHLCRAQSTNSYGLSDRLLAVIKDDTVNEIKQEVSKDGKM